MGTELMGWGGAAVTMGFGALRESLRVVVCTVVGAAKAAALMSWSAAVEAALEPKLGTPRKWC